VVIYLAVLAFVVGLGLPIAVIFAATAQGKATVAALEGISRQPESAGKVQLALIVGLALIEAMVIYALLIFFLLQTKLPPVEDVLKMGWIESRASAIGGPAKVTVTAEPDILKADGESKSEITIAVADTEGNRVIGQIITMTASSEQIKPPGQIQTPATNNNDGTYTAIYTAPEVPGAPQKTGTVTIKAMALNGESGEVTLTLRW